MSEEREGLRVVATIPAGSEVTSYNGRWLIVAPGRQPYMLDTSTGEETPVSSEPLVNESWTPVQLCPTV